MLQEAQHDAPEPGNLIDREVQLEQGHENNGNEHRVVNVNIDHRKHDQQDQNQSNHNNNNILQRVRDPETYQTYLTLATMLKYLNNGNAFAENHMED